MSCSEVSDEGWGLLTSVQVPGAGTLGLYEAKHSLAHQLPDEQGV